MTPERRKLIKAYERNYFNSRSSRYESKIDKAK